MRGSLQALLSGVIDYAGLFPPAQLGMDAAVEHYLRYKSGPESWAVSRFVCSTARLPELSSVISKTSGNFFVPVTAVGKASQTRTEWEDALAHDAEAMNDFNEATGQRAEIQAYEVRIPSHQEVSRCIRDLGGFEEADVYVELPWGDEMSSSIPALSDSEWLGVKARTGGLVPDAFPSAIDLAAFLHECISLEVAFKLTAGLHHPFPRVESGLPMHGFLNVLCACALIYGQDFSRTQAAAVLSEDDRSAFEWSGQELAWRGNAVDVASIRKSRELMIGFGSCSVEEPFADLAAEGLAD